MSSLGNAWPSVARRINSFGAIETMADVMLTRGAPEHIRSDNGAETPTEKKSFAELLVGFRAAKSQAAAADDWAVA
ncbi:hypothetical protein GGQ85_004393 [Nitrobacter vulgaris]|nr:hypothetical protein [Nitrobacter vulgaris]